MCHLGIDHFWAIRKNKTCKNPSFLQLLDILVKYKTLKQIDLFIEDPDEEHRHDEFRIYLELAIPLDISRKMLIK